MNKPSDYDSININSTQIPAGGYVCKIMDVKEVKSKAGRDMIAVSLDIAEGDYKDHFANVYKSDTRENKKWGCVYYILLTDKDGNTNRDFKRFCVAVEDSNEGFTVAWGDKFCAGFKNKLIGVLFGREQFLGNNGLAWSCKPKYLRDVKSIREGKFDVPEDKLYKDPTQTQSFVSYTEDVDDADPLPF
jgi:hypothetical protein